MSNDFMSAVTEVSSGSRGRSAEINAHRNEVYAAFEKMPGANAWFDGNLNLATSVALSTNTYTMTFANTPSGHTRAYRDGLVVKFVASDNNPSGGTNINVNSLGARAIKKADGSALAANDIVSGQVVVAVYNLANTEFRVTTFLGSELADASAAATAAAASQVAAASSASAASTSAAAALVSENAAAASAVLATTQYTTYVTSEETNNGTASQYAVERTGAGVAAPTDGQPLRIEIYDSKIAALNLQIRFKDGSDYGSYYTVYDRSPGNNNMHITAANGNNFLGAVGAVLDLEFSTSANGWIVRGYRVAFGAGHRIDASNDATVELDIPSTRDRIDFDFFNVVPVTNNVSLRFLLSNDGGTTFESSADYHTSGSYWGSDNNYDWIGLAYGVVCVTGASNGADGGISGRLSLYRPSDATKYTNWLVQASAFEGTNIRHIMGGGGREVAEAHDKIQFYFSSGNISTGRIQRVEN